MKLAPITLLCFGILTVSTFAQDSFQNLNFESANPGIPMTGLDGPYYQPVGIAFPGWDAYIGTVKQTEVLQNVYGHGQAEVILFGPSYAEAGQTGEPVNPGVIDGAYSVLLQAGLSPVDNTSLVGTSIAQTGLLPIGDQSLQFKAWESGFNVFTVSFNGIPLSPVAIGSGPNYTLYGCDISTFAGQTGQLEFTSDFTGHASWLGVDDITFSPQAVPEPSPLILTALGGIVFTIYRRIFQRKR